MVYCSCGWRHRILLAIRATMENPPNQTMKSHTRAIALNNVPFKWTSINFHRSKLYRKILNMSNSNMLKCGNTFQINYAAWFMKVKVQHFKLLAVRRHFTVVTNAIHTYGGLHQVEGGERLDQVIYFVSQRNKEAYTQPVQYIVLTILFEHFRSLMVNAVPRAAAKASVQGNDWKN